MSFEPGAQGRGPQNKLDPYGAWQNISQNYTAPTVTSDGRGWVWGVFGEKALDRAHRGI